MVRHYNIVISGRVQGVWYRGSAARKANELGLHGFVRNEPDGRVYAEVEGPENQLKQFVEWCKEGPEMARVQKVVFDEGPIAGFDDFEVVR